MDGLENNINTDLESNLSFMKTREEVTEIEDHSWEGNISRKFAIKEFTANNGSVNIILEEPFENVHVNTIVKNNKIDGQCTVTSVNGVLLGYLTLVDGMVTGPCTLNYETGKLHFKGRMEKGYRQGRGTEYDKFGNVIFDGFYDKGTKLENIVPKEEMNDYWKEYNAEHKLVSISQRDDFGRKEGICYMYNDAKIIQVSYWEQGKEIRVIKEFNGLTMTEYDEKKQKLYEGEYLDSFEFDYPRHGKGTSYKNNEVYKKTTWLTGYSKQGLILTFMAIVVGLLLLFVINVISGLVVTAIIDLMIILRWGCPKLLGSKLCTKTDLQLMADYMKTKSSKNTKKKAAEEPAKKELTSLVYSNIYLSITVILTFTILFALIGSHFYSILTNSYVNVFQDIYKLGLNKLSNLSGFTLSNIALLKSIKTENISMTSVDLSATLSAPECSDGQFLIEAVRTCKTHKYEELFEIYEGVYDYSTDPIYYQTECYAGTFYFCMNPVQHTIVLRDLDSDGWDDGSSLLLKNGNMSLSYRLDNGAAQSIVLNLVPSTSPIPTLPVFECIDGQFLIEAIRTCGSFGHEESFEIYQGAYDYSRDPVYKQDFCYAGTFYFCINPVQHTIVLRDSSMDGWSDGSSLLLKNGNMSLSYTLNGIVIAHVFTLTPILPIPTTPPIPTLPAPECNDGQVLIEAIRTCGSHIYDESFSIYEGVYDYSTDPIYEQTECYAGTFYFCMNPVQHTIVLRDNAMNGWDDHSSILFKNGSISQAYRLDNGDMKAIVFTLNPNPPPPECSDGQFLIEAIRTCGSFGHEESFEIYQGAYDYSRDPVYKQDFCYAGTFYFCINPVQHTIVLRDSSMDGWSDGSSLLLKNGNMSLSYTLNGIVIAHVFTLTPILPIPTTPPIPTLPAPECNDGQVLIEAIRTCGSHIYDESFSIYEGVYDYSTDPIYEQTECYAGRFYFCMYSIQHTIVLRDNNNNGWDNGSSLLLKNGNVSLSYRLDNGDMNAIVFAFSLTEVSVSPALASHSALSSTDILTTCAEDQSLLEIVRTCGVNGNEESFDIYYGVEPSSLTKVFGQSTCTVGTYYACISPVEHTLVMRDTGLNGWSSGSHLILKDGKVSFNYAMESGNASSHKVVNFGSAVDHTSSNTMMSEDRIKVTLLRSCGNSSDSEGFAIYEGASRDHAIYRQTYCIAGVVNLFLSQGLYTIVMTEANGQAWKQNSVVRIFKDGLLGSYRKTVMGAEESKHFECVAEFTTLEQSLVGSGVAQSNRAGMTGYSVENLFDISISTKYRTAVTISDFPVEVTYTFPDGHEYTMNKYVFINGDSMAAACNMWKIFGRKNEDSDEWVMLDSQDNVEWSETNQSKSFTVDNASAYNAYMFQCSAVVNIDDENNGSQLEMAEWNLIQV